MSEEVAQQCKQLSQASCRCEGHWLSGGERVEEEETFGVAPASAHWSFLICLGCLAVRSIFPTCGGIMAMRERGCCGDLSAFIHDLCYIWKLSGLNELFSTLLSPLTLELCLAVNLDRKVTATSVSYKSSLSSWGIHGPATHPKICPCTCCQSTAPGNFSSKLCNSQNSRHVLGKRQWACPWLQRWSWSLTRCLQRSWSFLGQSCSGFTKHPAREKGCGKIYLLWPRRGIRSGLLTVWGGITDHCQIRSKKLWLRPWLRRKRLSLVKPHILVLLKASPRRACGIMWASSLPFPGVAWEVIRLWWLRSFLPGCLHLGLALKILPSAWKQIWGASGPKNWRSCATRSLPIFGNSVPWDHCRHMWMWSVLTPLNKFQASSSCPKLPPSLRRSGSTTLSTMQNWRLTHLKRMTWFDQWVPAKVMFRQVADAPLPCQRWHVRGAARWLTVLPGRMKGWSHGKQGSRRRRTQVGSPLFYHSSQISIEFCDRSFETFGNILSHFWRFKTRTLGCTPKGEDDMRWNEIMSCYVTMSCRQGWFMA